MHRLTGKISEIGLSATSAFGEILADYLQTIIDAILTI